MYRLKILTVGKTKESWLQEALADYEKRLKPYLVIEWILFKTEEQFLKEAEKETSPILLDEGGVSLDSVTFSRWFVERLTARGGRLTFLIGGADGFPSEWKKRHETLSLSPLTFTHQMARLLLVEQCYRALEIDRGSPYHRV
jgi:23S rRNA (pseudouridine1915-N3)-methyltransferase